MDSTSYTDRCDPRVVAVVLTITATVAMTSFAQTPDSPVVLSDNGCTACHSVAKTGGGSASDLAGRSVLEDHTPAGLAAAMWSHSPEMWSPSPGMSEEIRALSPDEADELFAYFWSVRRFDLSGDAGRGKKYFTEKGCAGCHAINASGGGSDAPPVSEWEALKNPVLWAQSLWNHTDAMQDAMAAEGIEWPHFAEQEMVDLLVYLQNLRETRDDEHSLEFSSPTAGRALFYDRGCDSCHSSSPAFTSGVADDETPAGFHTMTGFAAGMWNHAPEMTAAIERSGFTKADFSAEEMADLISFVYYSGGFEEQGRARKGGKVYVRSGCQSCHGDPSSDQRLSGRHTAASMAAAASSHTLETLGQTRSEIKMSGQEMANLIAYLNR